MTRGLSHENKILSYNFIRRTGTTLLAESQADERNMREQAVP